MNNKSYPPVPLVKAWVLVVTSDRPQLQQGHQRASDSINKYFGSVTLAELYIEQIENDTEIILI